MKRTFLALLILITSLSLGTVNAIEYQGIGGRPANPRADEPKSESIFIHTATPGSTIYEAVSVINNRDEPVTFSVYGTDSIKSTDGAFACGQLADDKVNVGQWINMSTEKVTLPANSTRKISFTISVPQEVDVGEHNGCIVIQEDKPSRQSEGSSINLTTRTALRVAITIPGDIKRELKIEDYAVTKQSNGNFLISPSVRNLGNVSVETDTTVAVKDALFDYELEEFGGTYTVLRDNVSKWNFELKRPFWGGYFKADFKAVYENSNGEEVVLRTDPIKFFSWPTLYAWLIIISVLLFVFGIFRYLWMRIRFNSFVTKNWKNYTVKSGEDIKSIAKDYDVSWRVLARANNIKSPYVLKRGQKIKVPRD